MLLHRTANIMAVMRRAGLSLLLWLFIAAKCADALDDLTVTCGSSIKLQHASTKYRLHSHEVAYGRGSGQQSVTCYPDPDDANSLWTVHGTKSEPCEPGSAIRSNQRIRFQHVATRRWLHSHAGYQSPITGNQEVSCHGQDDFSDGGDVWILDMRDGTWQQDSRVRLKHQDTGTYLQSHNYRYNNPIAGQQEVCTVRTSGRNSEWLAVEGVYLAPQSSIGSGARDEL